MNNTISMSAEFEKRKNLRASVLTAVVGGLVLLVVILIKLSTPVVASPPVDDFVEIELPDLPNLGTSEVGSGNDQPQLPGDAGSQETAYNQPEQSAEEAVKDVTNDDEKSDDAPPVVKPKVNNVNATKTNVESKTEKTNNTTVPTPPAPPRPKATLSGTRGGTSGTGNGAETYKPGSGEGTGGGRGDQGVPGGTGPKRINSRTYNIPAQNFEDDFTESGKIALDIVVNENGKLISATYQAKGSTLSNRNQIEIAKRRAAQINYPKYDGGFKQTITMNFDVRN